MTWTTPRTWVTGEPLTASDLNAHLRDNLLHLESVQDAVVDGYILIRDEKAQGTDGGSFTTGDWRTRDLNTIAADPGGHASLNSNQITLPAGTYIVHAMAPAYTAGTHAARLRNISEGVTLANGFNAESSVGPEMTYSHVVGRFTLTAAAVIELQHRCTITHATNGFGRNANFTTEIYSTVQLWKVA